MALSTVIRRLPWQTLFQSTYLFRRFLFAKRPETVDHLVVEEESTESLQRLFLSNGLVKGDYASYYYYGEDLNMVGGMHKADEFEWYQYHVRGFEEDGEVRLRPHTELYWRVYPRKHVGLVNLDVAEGIERTRALLDECGIEYTVVRVEEMEPGDEEAGPGSASDDGTSGEEEADDETVGGVEATGGEADGPHESDDDTAGDDRRETGDSDGRQDDAVAERTKSAVESETRR